ncbi:DUF1553 domain-containing protein [Botrimarina sp.]|uniref:DUF1553 domain-containing protein n=1 Tax=Botrimarina sp. TaxID=2795802 RepID=UPI0032EC6495
MPFATLPSVVAVASALKSSRALALIVTAASAPASAIDAARADLSVDYNRDVRPILQRSCFACHGADEQSRSAGLRLDRRDDAVAAGAIVPGDPEQSELVRRVESEDGLDRMPPAETANPLGTKEQELLRRWVSEGARYERHWAWIPPVRGAPPQVAFPGWESNPIDCFVGARLEQAGLTPNPQASKHELARRVCFDLTGLPPSRKDLERFLEDTSNEAYERYVDRLLATPAWGEHRARYWLDYARYADTHGIHFDNRREMWTYRDWVIRAFNENLPFDEFTIANLAGDLLPDASLEDRIGSGFNRCNTTTDEAGIIEDEYRVLYTRDRVETVATVWMGLTAGCAACHDHKYDPLTQREFYQLSAFFNNLSHDIRDKNQRAAPPTIVSPPAGREHEWESLQSKLSRTLDALAEREATSPPEFETWLARIESGDADPPAPPSQGASLTMCDSGLQVHAPLNHAPTPLAHTPGGQSFSAKGAEQAQWVAGALSASVLQVGAGSPLRFASGQRFRMDEPFSVSLWIRRSAAAKSGVLVSNTREAHPIHGWELRLENGHLVFRLCESWPVNAIGVLTTQPLPEDKWVHVAAVYDGSSRAAGAELYVDGVADPKLVQADDLRSYDPTAPVQLTIGAPDGENQSVVVALEDLRVFDRSLLPREATALATAPAAIAAASKLGSGLTDDETRALRSWWSWTHDTEHRGLVEELQRLTAVRDDLAAAGSIAYISAERPQEPDAYVLERGEYDQRRERVSPATPAFLPPLEHGLLPNRLGLASWLVSPGQPLVARVTVNRFWQEVFGVGLVATPGDFGVTGEYPSHPALLDWLAVEFVESGWDVKRLLKLIVTSSAYKQSANARPESLRLDPANRLLSRGPRKRLDAEMIRDAALHASGLLVDRVGGASVMPYQPEGVWESVAMIGSNTRDYVAGQGEDLYRRSVYTFWKRSAPPALMSVLDAPSRETCTVVRQATNTPLQALATMNSEQLVEAARVAASNAMRSSEDDESRLQDLAIRVLSRRFETEEMERLGRVLAAARSEYGLAPEAAAGLLSVGRSSPPDEFEEAELAAWTVVANLVMNLDESLTK